MTKTTTYRLVEQFDGDTDEWTHRSLDGALGQMAERVTDLLAEGFQVTRRGRSFASLWMYDPSECLGWGDVQPRPVVHVKLAVHAVHAVHAVTTTRS